ncbi:MAG: translation initiation factor IF-2 subunit gamma [Candidatus Aenigmatarchaeota archaeon]
MDGKKIPESNIGTVGHVEHGKSSLVRALSGKWTGVHSEEQKRGLTIRLGYADVTLYKCSQCDEPECYSTSPKCLKHGDNEALRTVSLIDSPGHESLMATVLAGASLMDGALFIIAANEACPQPQTREHLMALNMTGVDKIIVLQNKIDLVDEAKVIENYQQIKSFFAGSVADNKPIIPISAQQKINLDVLIQIMEKEMPTPKRDASKPPKMLLLRSFDVNKPGYAPNQLNGGVLGGSLIQGEFAIGDEIEIRPGIMVHKENKTFWQPLITKIAGLQKASTNLERAGPGGLLGLMTELDPSLTKSDSLAGSVVGRPDKLPDVLGKISVDVKLLERVVGAREELNVEKIKSNETLMLTVGTSRTVGVVKSAREDVCDIDLKIPVCAERGNRVAISRQVGGRWRLIGSGVIL